MAVNTTARVKNRAGGELHRITLQADGTAVGQHSIEGMSFSGKAVVHHHAGHVDHRTGPQGHGPTPGLHRGCGLQGKSPGGRQLGVKVR